MSTQQGPFFSSYNFVQIDKNLYQIFPQLAKTIFRSNGEA